MRIQRYWDRVPESAQGAAVALGNFDGVHRGHRALLDATKAVARRSGAPLGVMAFEPHPQEHFRRGAEPFRLTPFRPKVTILKELGVEILYAVPFRARLAAMTAEAFVEEVLVRGVGLRHLVVGADFQYGKARGGNVETLRRDAARLGFGLTVFEPVMGGEGKISSTDIRRALKDGRPRDAAALLGHDWTVEGHVRPGDRRGRTIGFPTANLSLRGYLEPALGVYAVRVGVDDRHYGGVANYGRRPTFDKADTLLEVHLFDFDGDLYGRTIAVSLIDYIRPERRFDGLESLKAQIAADAAAARRILSERA